jgi:hypothetical protein
MLPFLDHQISRSQIRRWGGFALQITRSADHRSPDWVVLLFRSPRSADHRSPDGVVLLFRSPDQPITDHPIELPRNYASSSSSKQQVWVELLEEGEPQRGGTKSLVKVFCAVSFSPEGCDVHNPTTTLHYPCTQTQFFCAHAEWIRAILVFV